MLYEPEVPMTSWDPLRFSVAAEARTTWLFNSAAKRLNGTRRPMAAGLSLQSDVLRPSEQVAVRLDLGFLMDSASDSSPLQERFESKVLSLGVSLRYQVFRWLAPYARLAGGVGWDKLTLSDGETDLHDRKTFGHGSLGAGVLLRSPGLRLWQGTRAPFLGLLGNIEGGYFLAGSSEFSLQSSPDTQAPTPIPTTAVAFGKIERSVPYLRVSLGIAF